jgi:ribonuclease HI
MASNNEELTVFSDGSALLNGTKGCRCSSATVWPNGEFPDRAFYLPPESPRSNNRAEFYAIICAYRQADEIDPERTRTLHVFTDCMLAVKTCTEWMESWHRKGWKKSSPGEIKNLDMVRVLYEFYNGRGTVFTHVKAHTGKQDFNSIWNDRVDRLAYSAVHNDDNSRVVFDTPKPEGPKIDKFFKSAKKRKRS